MNGSEKLNMVFKIISFFDDCRWGDKSNYYQINYFDNTKMDDDSILLTHWLCYITNRQMKNERIWDVGSFVFSELVVKYKELVEKYKDNPQTLIQTLLNPKSTTSFVRSKQEKKRTDETYEFVGYAPPNDKITRFYPQDMDIKENVVRFQSRYMPEDYFVIRATLLLLAEYEGSISKFIACIYKHYIKENPKKETISRLAFSLYLLSYATLTDVKAKKKSYSDMKAITTTLKEEIPECVEKVKSILNNSRDFEDEFKKFKADDIFSSKRMWCVLRDFLKSRKEFNPHFRDALKSYLSSNDIKNLCDKKWWNQLELPGDTWNNNTIFRKCILEETEHEKDNRSINRILRDYYDRNLKRNETESGYPEQFDVTFDFVQRMCEKYNCKIVQLIIFSNIENQNPILRRSVSMIEKNTALLH